MVELLAPAGSYESLQAAVNAGADAVYIGGSLFGARAYADNPDEEHLLRGIEYCHLHGRKLYMTVNTLLKERELEEMLYPFLLPYYRAGVDGLIVQDPGVIRFVQEYFPGLELHASTQMTVTSAYGARLLQRQGITRVVPARELSLGEIRTIIDETGIEVETFIHGAMCYCYSGQCLLSSMIGGRSGNRGRCAQPCRLPYSLPGAGKSHLLSMKDMCTLELLPELIGAGISSLKIEGRMKRPEYTAGVVRVYRKYIDLYLEKGQREYRINDGDRRDLMDLYNRGGFSPGYYNVQNGREMMAMQRPNHQGTRAARIQSVTRGKLQAEALEDLHRQDVLELPSGTELTLSGEVKKGGQVSFPLVGGRTGQGGIIYRTKNESLLQDLKKWYVNTNLQEKIKGELRIFRNSPAILSLQYLEHMVTVSGDIAEAAQHNPTAEDTVRRQMQKTGNTPFVFETLNIHMDEDLFVSIKGLNELRRGALAALQNKILEESARGTYDGTQDGVSADRYAKGPSGGYGETSGRGAEAGTEGPDETARPGGRSRAAYRMNVLVTTREQLDAVLAFSKPVIDTVYLDSMLLGPPKKLGETCGALEGMIQSVQQKGWKCFLSFSPVFRRMDQMLFMDSRVQSLMGRMDGFLLHTLDQIGFAEEFSGKNGGSLLAADDSVYAYNNRAVLFLEKHGITRRTLPSELNFRELMKLSRGGAELNVYGYQALMQSAQCLTKNTSGCRNTPKVIYLKDRKNTEFPVLNRCPVCCNTIYNSVPLHLGGCREEIMDLAPEFIRLTFTVEDGRETGHVLDQYYRLLFAGIKNGDCLEGTRGHFRRGVE